jgi:hypothetical protein
MKEIFFNVFIFHATASTIGHGKAKGLHAINGKTHRVVFGAEWERRMKKE